LSREADLVVVSAHWGPNMRREPPAAFRRFARGLVDAGADVFWGHSAHLFQAVEPRDRGVILYDTGGLVEAGPRGVRRVELVPTRIDPREGVVDRADASARSFALSRMRELCEPFGTELRVEEGRALVPVR
jgi:poly-gamma-glutamate synthesis protein (capsule biosynthesis protein)